MAQPVSSNPTWEVPIREYFNEVDINHMLQISRGELDLGSYEHVATKVERIWRRVSEKTMPIPPSEVWTDEMIKTFEIWKNNGCPKG
jgi:hypothetical protein